MPFAVDDRSYPQRSGSRQRVLVLLTEAVESTLSWRLFEDDDADRLTVLLHAAYAELGAMGLNYTAVDQDVPTTLARARGGQCWVVEDRDAIVASLTISLPPTSELQSLTGQACVAGRAWLNQVAVAPTHRGLGLASQLWAVGRAWAISQGATSIGVDTAVPAEHLVGLYAAWGFVPADTIHWPGKTYDSAVMVRVLASVPS